MTAAMSPLMLADVLDKLLDAPVLVFIVGGVLGLAGIVGGTIAGVARRKAREETRREIAAYVAEGSIDADKAIEMLKAGEEAG